jgi:hypothetical protein
MAETAPLLVADPTVYPVEEKVGEDILQRWIMELLRPLLARFLAERGRPWFVGADQFIYYEQHNSLERVSPDIYVLPNIPPDTPVAAWKVWETGVVPSFALEIVSSNWQKDYIEAPERYAKLGTQELIVFDPKWQARPSDFGVRWQIWRRTTAGLHRIETSTADRVRSHELGAWLRVLGSGTATRLRIGVGSQGDKLYPTAEEAERQAKEAERQAKEAERQAKEAERQAKEAERQAKEAALAELAELRARLNRG